MVANLVLRCDDASSHPPTPLGARASTKDLSHLNVHCCTQAPVVSFFQTNWPNTNARSIFFFFATVLDFSTAQCLGKETQTPVCLSCSFSCWPLLHSDLFPAQRQPNRIGARKQQNEIARSWNRVVDRFSARLCCRLAAIGNRSRPRRKADRSNPSTCTAAIMGRSLLSLIPIRFPLLFCACVL